MGRPGWDEEPEGATFHTLELDLAAFQPLMIRGKVPIQFFEVQRVLGFDGCRRGWKFDTWLTRATLAW